MENLKPISILRIIVYLIVFSSYFILLLKDHYISWLTREDGLVENIGAFFFIMTSGLFFIAYYRSLRPGNDTHVLIDQNRRNLFYLFLGIFFMICFGEEISWGQRIFNWGTAELFKALNSQGETNLHNLWYFNGRLPGNPHISIMGIRISANFYFSVFWLLYCVIIPLINKVSHRTRSFLEKIRLPIVPLWIGGLFLSHAVFFHIIYNYLPYTIPVRLVELKETNYAFMFFVFACHENTYIQKEQKRRA